MIPHKSTGQGILFVEHEGLFASVTVLPLDISEKPNRFGSEKSEDFTVISSGL